MVPVLVMMPWCWCNNGAMMLIPAIMLTSLLCNCFISVTAPSVSCFGMCYLSHCIYIYISLLKSHMQHLSHGAWKHVLRVLTNSCLSHTLRTLFIIHHGGSDEQWTQASMDTVFPVNKRETRWTNWTFMSRTRNTETHKETWKGSICSCYLSN